MSPSCYSHFASNICKKLIKTYVTLTFRVTPVSSLGRLFPAFLAKNQSLYLVSEKQKIHNKTNNNTTAKILPYRQ